MRSVVGRAKVADGRRIAELVAAAIHDVPPAPELIEDLARLRPLLERSACAGLVWWACRRVDDEPSVEALRDIARAQTMRHRLAELELERLVGRLHVAGIEPIIGKGWAVAAAYPSPGLRFYGDFDLYVRPDHAGETLRTVAASPVRHGLSVDVHAGASYLDDRPYTSLWERAELRQLGQTSVRVFAPDDHVRLLALHMLAEGATRPQWLCDLALLIRDGPSGFDVDRFMEGDQRRTDWAVAALGLAGRVLHVDPHRLIGGHTSCPPWMVRAVHRTWGTAPPTKGQHRPMASVGHDPRSFLAELVRRWPSPIEASFGMRARVTRAPRLPFQIADSVRRGTGFARSRRT